MFRSLEVLISPEGSNDYSQANFQKYEKDICRNMASGNVGVL